MTRITWNSARNGRVGLASWGVALCPELCLLHSAFIWKEWCSSSSKEGSHAPELNSKYCKRGAEVHAGFSALLLPDASGQFELVRAQLDPDDCLLLLMGFLKMASMKWFCVREYISMKVKARLSGFNI